MPRTPRSLGPRNLLISGDVLGLASQFVEKVLGPEVIAPAFAGASGDIDPWYRVLPGFETENGWVPEPVLLGNLLGTEVVHAFRAAKTGGTDTTIRTGIATLELPGKPSSGGENEPATKPLCVTTARIGDVAFVGLGCELLTEVGWRSRRFPPIPTRSLSRTAMVAPVICRPNTCTRKVATKSKAPASPPKPLKFS